MEHYQKEFIEFALQHQVLKFGEFTLKSGRVSPYFFNTGEFKSGHALKKLGEYYAVAIESNQTDYDMLYGPAYKGIPLATATGIGLASQFDKDVPVCFNRKEVKAHGEGGRIIGAPLQGKVLVIDDVVSAGVTYREAVEILAQTDATFAGMVISVDRQERGEGSTSAVQEIQEHSGMPVISIINLESIIEYLSGQADMAESLDKVLQYQAEWGVASRKSKVESRKL